MKQETGTIQKSLVIIANGITLINKEFGCRFYTIPIILLQYIPPKNAHRFAKGRRFKLWIKLEKAQYKKMQNMINKGLIELSIWFDEENALKLKEFI